MGRASKNYCNNLINKYNEKIDDKIYALEKNFGQMDLENADIQTDMAQILANIVVLFEQLKGDLDNYYFE